MYQDIIDDLDLSHISRALVKECGCKNDQFYLKMEDGTIHELFEIGESLFGHELRKMWEMISAELGD